MSDYEYEYSDDEYGEFGEEGEDVEETAADDPRIALENDFVIAEDTKGRNAAEALSLFDSVISKESELFPEEVTWRFKALLHTIDIQLRAGEHGSVLDRYGEMLRLLPKVTSNEGNEAVTHVLEEVDSAGVPEDVRDHVYDRTLDVLRDSNERLWFTTAMRVAQSVAEKGDAAGLAARVEELHSSLRTSDGREDESKATQLLELYALRVRLASLTRSWGEIKGLHQRVQELASAAIADPRVMGSVHETFGRMHMERQAWEDAYQEFFDCFKAYQAAGNPKAVVLLRYVLLVSMVAGMQVDPFDSQEAKAYQRNPSVDAMVRLRRAYDEGDIKTFISILDDPKTGVQDDDLLKRYISPLLDNVRKEMVLRLIRPYSYIRIAYLAKQLRVPERQAESLLVALVLEGKLAATIDQVDGLVRLAGSAAAVERSYAAIDRAADALSTLCQNLESRLNPEY